GAEDKKKARRHLHRENAQHGQQPGGEVAVGGERSEARRQIADDARKDEDESEETEAVQGRDGTLRFDVVHRLELGPNVSTETKQPRNITQDEEYSEKGFR